MLEAFRDGRQLSMLYCPSTQRLIHLSRLTHNVYAYDTSSGSPVAVGMFFDPSEGGQWVQDEWHENPLSWSPEWN